MKATELVYDSNYLDYLLSFSRKTIGHLTAEERSPMNLTP